ncbi:MAG: hypothetical protein WA916_08910 [Arcobacter sp.]|uniref:hypothetical protein n=1 Tax=Arcobacter sp. TaxID=1872629 RepID=UPI003C763EE1
MSKNEIIGKKSFWDSRINLKNKPSLSHRTIEVIDYIMEEEGLPLGTTLEKLMTSSNLYAEVIEKLKDDYPDIEDR